MNEAIARKALENLRARVAELEAERNAARAETERLRAELAEARRGKVDQMLGRLDDWSGDLATVVADRDRLAGQVKALADEWDETITSGVMRGQEWEQCLRANLPRLRAALGGTEAGR